MLKPTSVFLVGPMGAGKTTVGRHLATALHLHFVDADQEIQRRTGVDIPTIFEFEGEAGFRERERAVIDELTGREGVVVATGGGAVLHPDNRRHLTARGLVVYLSCSPEQQYERTLRDRSRPLLQSEDPLARLRDLADTRDPLYREVADLVISTEKRSASAVARDISRQMADLRP